MFLWFTTQAVIVVVVVVAVVVVMIVVAHRRSLHPMLVAWGPIWILCRLGPDSVPISLVLGPDCSVWVLRSTFAGFFCCSLNQTPPFGR